MANEGDAVTIKRDRVPKVSMIAFYAKKGGLPHHLWAIPLSMYPVRMNG